MIGQTCRDCKFAGPAERVAPLDGPRRDEGAAVVTSGQRQLAPARLVAAGLPLPSVLVPADEVPRGKPDPAGYLLGAAGLGLVRDPRGLSWDGAALRIPQEAFLRG